MLIVYNYKDLSLKINKYLTDLFLNIEIAKKSYIIRPNTKLYTKNQLRFEKRSIFNYQKSLRVKRKY